MREMGRGGGRYDSGLDIRARACPSPSNPGDAAGEVMNPYPRESSRSTGLGVPPEEEERSPFPLALKLLRAIVPRRKRDAARRTMMLLRQCTSALNASAIS